LPTDQRDSSQIVHIAIEWNPACNSHRRMENALIAAKGSRGASCHIRSEMMGGAGAPPGLTVNLECGLAADTRRIFRALTVPEYMEAWICVPCDHQECHNVASCIANGFLLEHFCSSESTTTIAGTYFSFLTRKLRFSWRVRGALRTRDTLVDIRLYGDFDKSVLRLRHFGFESEEDSNWHKELWSASIARLSKLFNGPPRHGERQGKRVHRQSNEIGCES
jgi:uncharacterized protein YndB with AHSA1/START domain